MQKAGTPVLKKKKYYKVASSSIFCLVARPRIYRLFMKGKFNAYLLTLDFTLDLFALIPFKLEYSQKIKNKYWKANTSAIDVPPVVPGVSKDAPESTKHTIWGLVR